MDSPVIIKSTLELPPGPSPYTGTSRSRVQRVMDGCDASRCENGDDETETAAYSKRVTWGLH